MMPKRRFRTEPTAAPHAVQRAILPAVHGRTLVFALCVSCTGVVQGGAAGGDNPGDGLGSPRTPAQTGTNTGGGSGTVVSTGGTGGGPPVVLPPTVDNPKLCQDVAPFSSPIRRLTRSEYDATITSLLGDASHPSRDFAVETSGTGFDTATDAAVVNDGIATQYVSAANGLAKNAAANMAMILGCDTTAKGEDPCAKDFIARFGRRAFRRPLAADEQLRWEGFYSANKTSFGFAPAVEQVLRAFLMSPHFLYRVEMGQGIDPQTKQTRLSSYEMATRLSYLFWGTMPDEELLAAADKGALSQPAQIVAQAQRLLSHPSGGRVFRDFYSQWMKLDRLDSLSRGANFTPALAAAMREETATYFDRMIREKGARWSDLMTSPTTWVNADLAAIYGITGVTGTAFREVTRPADRHRGFLTQPALLTMQSDPGNSASAIHRGVFLRKHIMCDPVPPPPADVVIPNIPPENPMLTARQQLENKTQTGEPCRTCHSRINPPGYAFGKFDQVGRFRDTDANNRPIDTTGTLVGSDVDGAFTGHTDLVDRLARSDRAQACVVTEWFRYTMARTETTDDDCRIKQWQDAFVSSKGSVTALLSKIVTSNSFLFKETP